MNSSLKWWFKPLVQYFFNLKSSVGTSFDPVGFFLFFERLGFDHFFINRYDLVTVILQTLYIGCVFHHFHTLFSTLLFEFQNLDYFRCQFSILMEKIHLNLGRVRKSQFQMWISTMFNLSTMTRATSDSQDTSIRISKVRDTIIPL